MEVNLLPTLSALIRKLFQSVKKTGRREESSIYATYSLFRKIAQGVGLSLIHIYMCIRDSDRGITQIDGRNSRQKKGYGYKGRYLFEANLRADASSRFGVNQRWGYFPSFSGG